MSEKSILIVQLEGSLLPLPMLPLCLPQTYYSSHCNINIHLLFYPPYCTGSQLKMKPIAYTFWDTNSKPRARIWQKIFHQKQQKQYITLPSQNSVRHSTTWANWGSKLQWLSNICRRSSLHGIQVYGLSTAPHMVLQRQGEKAHYRPSRPSLHKVLCFSKVGRTRNSFRAT